MAISVSTPLRPSTVQQNTNISLDNKTLPLPITTNTTHDFSNEKIALNDNENFIIVSPYDEQPHLLDLRTLDMANQILALALTSLQCLREDYATTPYTEIFNWPEIVEKIQQLASASNFEWKESSFFIVVFRSQIPPTTVYADLGVLDKAAHVEATESGGFLKYWFGSPDENGRNLATCVWRSTHDARIGSVGDAHKKAAGAARKLYTEWEIERLRFRIKDNAKEWEIVKWVE